MGNDAFLFTSIKEGRDKVANFGKDLSNGTDWGDNVFRISAKGFGGGLVAGGSLSASQFQTGSSNVAQNGSVRFIFNEAGDELWFDTDGSSAAAAVLVADTAMNAAVTRTHILLV